MRGVQRILVLFVCASFLSLACGCITSPPAGSNPVSSVAQTSPTGSEYSAHMPNESMPGGNNSQPSQETTLPNNSSSSPLEGKRFIAYENALLGFALEYPDYLEAVQGYTGRGVLETAELGPLAFDYASVDFARKEESGSQGALMFIEIFSVNQSLYNRDNLEYTFDRIMSPQTSILLREKQLIEKGVMEIDGNPVTKYVFAASDDNPADFDVHYAIRWNIDNRSGKIYHVCYLLSRGEGGEGLSPDDATRIMDSFHVGTLT